MFFKGCCTYQHNTVQIWSLCPADPEGNTPLKEIPCFPWFSTLSCSVHLWVHLTNQLTTLLTNLTSTDVTKDRQHMLSMSPCKGSSVLNSCGCAPGCSVWLKGVWVVQHYLFNWSGNNKSLSTHCCGNQWWVRHMRVTPTVWEQGGGFTGNLHLPETCDEYFFQPFQKKSGLLCDCCGGGGILNFVTRFPKQTNKQSDGICGMFMQIYEMKLREFA